MVAEPTTSPEQRDGELRSALEQIQSVMAVPALRCGLMSSSWPYQSRSCLVPLTLPILDRLLLRASPTRMWRNLMVTSLLGFSLHLGNPHMSVHLKCIYLPRRPCTSRQRTKEHLCSLARHGSCIVLYIFNSGVILLYHDSLLTMPSAGAERKVGSYNGYASSSACGCTIEVRGVYTVLYTFCKSETKLRLLFCKSRTFFASVIGGATVVEMVVSGLLRHGAQHGT